MKISNEKLTFDTTDLSQTSCTSVAVPLHHIANFAVQIVTTGAPVGTFKLQVSCDYGVPGTPASATTWSDLPSATMAVSAAGVSFLNVVDTGYTWVRVVYTKTSGTGAISSAKINAKGI